MVEPVKRGSLRVVLAPDAEQKPARFAAVRPELPANLEQVDVPHLEPPTGGDFDDDPDRDERAEIDRSCRERAHRPLMIPLSWGGRNLGMTRSAASRPTSLYPDSTGHHITPNALFTAEPPG